MHKDKPPGLFDFAERRNGYLIGFFFTTGLVLSILVRTTLLVIRDNAGASNARKNADALEAAAAARKPAGVQPPESPPAVRY
jgi:hypothetical protein